MTDSETLHRQGLELLEQLHGGHALKIGATKRQIVEVILQLTFYAGGPAVRNSLISLRDLLVI